MTTQANNFRIFLFMFTYTTVGGLAKGESRFAKNIFIKRE
ncbi:hypothetical protein HMPREF0322_02042 [Desulfitobacterium hafniense DP7]|uniref:Uncharacterized protein n=1 Tax=Desulfitobacterium hafniense DP7 TaxID=537010 RepID=G9XM56_DESHA|nr:hypothetical protein HMPREF0322_02042 [Desulfitobacterium hafniense DP7]